MNINDVKADLQIVGYSVRKLNIDNGFTAMNSDDEKLQRQIEAEYEVKNIFDFNEELVGGILDIVIDINIFNDESTATANLELEGCFAMPKEVEIDRFQEMLAINGTASLYSIARGIISNATSQMCMNGTIVIPMVNAFKMREKSK